MLSAQAEQHVGDDMRMSLLIPRRVPGRPHFLISCLSLDVPTPLLVQDVLAVDTLVWRLLGVSRLCTCMWRLGVRPAAHTQQPPHTCTQSAHTQPPHACAQSTLWVLPFPSPSYT